jgi:hypothetical protein
MHRKEKDIYEYFKEYKHTKEDWCVKEDSCRDFPFGANDDVVQGPKELGLKIAEELGNNMVHFQVYKMPILFYLLMQEIWERSLSLITTLFWCRCWGKNLKQRISRWPKNMFLLVSSITCNIDGGSYCLPVN